MVAVIAPHHRMGGMSFHLSFPPPWTAVLSYAGARSASGVLRAASRRRCRASVAERGKASRAARRPALISMKRL